MELDLDGFSEPTPSAAGLIPGALASRRRRDANAPIKALMLARDQSDPAIMGVPGFVNRLEEAH